MRWCVLCPHKMLAFCSTLGACAMCFLVMILELGASMVQRRDRNRYANAIASPSMVPYPAACGSSTPETTLRPTFIIWKCSLHENEQLVKLRVSQLSSPKGLPSKAMAATASQLKLIYFWNAHAWPSSWPESPSRVLAWGTRACTRPGP